MEGTAEMAFMLQLAFYTFAMEIIPPWRETFATMVDAVNPGGNTQRFLSLLSRYISGENLACVELSATFIIVYLDNGFQIR